MCKNRRPPAGMYVYCFDNLMSTAQFAEIGLLEETDSRHLLPLIGLCLHVWSSLLYGLYELLPV